MRDTVQSNCHGSFDMPMIQQLQLRAWHTYPFNDNEEQFIGKIKHQCKSKKYRQYEGDGTTNAATIESSFRSTLWTLASRFERHNL